MFRIILIVVNAMVASYGVAMAIVEHQWPYAALATLTLCSAMYIEKHKPSVDFILTAPYRAYVSGIISAEECNEMLEDIGCSGRVQPMYEDGVDILTGFRI
jgi:hypothetical protein